MKKIALIANGEIEDLSFLKQALTQFTYLVAIDGGLSYLNELGITPHAIVGDFDSAPEKLLKQYQNIPQIPLLNPDQSDLEKALHWLETEKPVTVFGALGHRLDHTMSNLFLLARFPQKLFFDTEQEQLYALSEKTTLTLPIGTTLSLLPLGTVQGVTTKGLQWELADATLSKTFYSISNVTREETIMITVASGDLILCINKKF